MSDCSCPRRTGELRFGAYRVPQPAGCDVEYARYHHRDLAQLDEVEIEAELHALVAVLALLPGEARAWDRAWLVERRHHLCDAARRHGPAAARSRAVRGRFASRWRDGGLRTP